jgi:hypothetical protein
MTDSNDYFHHPTWCKRPQRRSGGDVLGFSDFMPSVGELAEKIIDLQFEEGIRNQPDFPEPSAELSAALEHFTLQLKSVHLIRDKEKPTPREAVHFRGFGWDGRDRVLAIKTILLDRTPFGIEVWVDMNPERIKMLQRRKDEFGVIWFNFEKVKPTEAQMDQFTLHFAGALDKEFDFDLRVAALRNFPDYKQALAKIKANSTPSRYAQRGVAMTEAWEALVRFREIWDR